MESGSVKYPTFIVHDVLQTSRFKPTQRNSIITRGPFADQFLRYMPLWEGYPVTLAVLGEGCAREKEVVAYIREHPEWSVQMHGWNHVRYDALSIEDMRRAFGDAKKAIEDTFGVGVTEYYPPFNAYNTVTASVVAELGVKQMERYRKVCYYKKEWDKCVQMDVHYWDTKDCYHSRRVHRYFTHTPTYIIGAPRSGTTALMRLMAGRDAEAMALKEIEHIWSDNRDVRMYYATKLMARERMSILDKNVRNSLRLPTITALFPDAKFVHIIRDGRAAANSWRNWARKTNKPDQSIEGAAKQWCDYLSAIFAHKDLMPSYTEVRYETLCETEPYFVSRNDKWQLQMTEEEKGLVTKIQRPLLAKLGYL